MHSWYCDTLLADNVNRNMFIFGGSHSLQKVFDFNQIQK